MSPTDHLGLDQRARVMVLIDTRREHIAVKEAYLHCAKAIMRAQLWQPDARVERAVLPTMNEMLRDQIGGENMREPAEPQEVMVARHKTELYATK